jgi:Tfp pilus assembly protein PilF
MECEHGIDPVLSLLPNTPIGFAQLDDRSHGMNPPRLSRIRSLALFCWVALMVLSGHLPAQNPVEASRSTNGVRAIAIQGTNWWIAPAGAADWVMASTRMPQDIRPGDRLRTGRNTRLFLQTPHLGVIQVPPLSTLEIAPSPSTNDVTWLRLLKGMLYFFHRGSPTDVEVHTRSASAAIRGTEFVAEAREDGGLLIRVVDGRVGLSNDQGTVLLEAGEGGEAVPGQKPQRTPVIYSLNVIQWCLYYPVVLDADELLLTEEEGRLLAGSLAAYRSGDLLSALEQYPEGREPESDREQVYLAALLLATGQVAPSETLLDRRTLSSPTSDRTARLAGALRLMQAAVRSGSKPASSAGAPELASEWLAESYYQQSIGKLGPARDAAQAATLRSAGFGPAWIRLAELEFGHGRSAEAGKALRRGVSLAPRHAAAFVLQGFQLCAQEKVSAALEQFERALTLDPGLGNAWLGRGLCRIQQGSIREGLEDLEVAAAAEPQRALLRSYLGKAFAAAGDRRRAELEFSLAKSMDPNDPTAWLYAALLDQEQGRINEGIRHLEKSKQLNEGRRLYRSRHLLDEDQAVRGANLSALYRDAGFQDLSRREAVDAVNSDYANYSAHLFLANSYHELRDPGQVDLRYETPWFGEYLVANLLAPAAAGTLSQTVSAQEFSRLFERDGLGFTSLTEYRSSGEWVQSAAQYGLLGSSAYSLEEDYRSSPGQRPNNDLEQLTVSLKLKQQLGPNDSLFLQTVYYDASGGDVGRVYDPANAALFRSGYRFEERQEPLLFAGYHHRWSPGQHTLVTAGRLHDAVAASDPAQPVLLVSKNLANEVTGTLLTSVDQRYRSEQETFTAELQHIAQLDSWTFIGGARAQEGDFDTWSRQQNLADQAAALPAALEQRFDPSLHRWSGYGYAQWQVDDPVRLFGGITYDYLQSPSNFRFAPVLGDEQTQEQWSPKAGFLWNITSASRLRGAYTRSLGGVSLDQSYRLEPSQVAGFAQAWRGLIPDSVVGSQSGGRVDMGSLEWDHRFATETYVAVRGELARSRLSRQVGVFDLNFLAEPSSTLEELDFREASLIVTVNQLVGENVALGTQYRLNNARLDDQFPQIPGSVPHFFPPYQLRPRQELESLLHQVQFFAVINHDSGFFGRVESVLFAQSNQGYEPALPGDTFWQFNVHAGYRFPNRRAEVRLGLLNLADRDYRLNPLNLSAELPRERTFVASLRLSF